MTTTMTLEGPLVKGYSDSIIADLMQNYCPACGLIIFGRDDVSYVASPTAKPINERGEIYAARIHGHCSHKIVVQ